MQTNMHAAMKDASLDSRKHSYSRPSAQQYARNAIAGRVGQPCVSKAAIKRQHFESEKVRRDAGARPTVVLEYPRMRRVRHSGELFLTSHKCARHTMRFTRPA